MLNLALVGHPVAHSLSPVMHRAGLAYASIAGDYELLDVRPEDCSGLIAFLADKKICGFNVTVPHKETVFNLAAQAGSEFTDEAILVGAVNCLRFDSGGRLTAHNTDCRGFMAALQAAPAYSGQTSHACLLGAGGAARACVVGLALAGCRRIDLVARTAGRAQALVDELAPRLSSVQLRVLAIDGDWPGDADLVVNCTPMGLGEECLPDWFSGKLPALAKRFFFDTVYKSGGTTAAVSACRESGGSAADGLLMLVEQALLSFEFWTGRRIPQSVYLGAALA